MGISQLLGMDSSNPFGMQAGQYLLGYLKNSLIPSITGIDSSNPIWNTVLYSNMTTFGTMMQDMNASANAIGMQNMMQMQAATRYQTIEGWQKLVTSEAAFRRMSKADRGGFEENEYEDFIKWKSRGMAENPIVTMALSAWDPTGEAMAGYNLREASANVARNAMWRGDDRFKEKASAITDLFTEIMTDKDGNQARKTKYDKSAYGMFSLNEATELTAALTKNLNFAAGVDDEAGIKKAADDLRDRVQRLTRAMSPLKDFFGDDVPNMIRFLEEVSGRSIQEMDSQAVHKLTREITSNVATGVYTMDQMRALSMQLYGSVGQMNTGFYMDQSVTAMANQILPVVNAGYTPLMESQQSFRQGVADRTLRHAGSQMANNANLAYAVWASKRGENEDKSIETFERLYTELTQGSEGKPGMSATQAMLTLSGEANVQRMARAGYRSVNYAEAAKSGLGGRLAEQSDIRRKFDTFIWTKETKELQDAAISLRDRILSSNGTEDMDALNRSIMEGTDENLKAVWTEMNSNTRWKALNRDATSFRQRQVADQKAARAREIQANAELIDNIFGEVMANPTTIGEGIVRMLLGKGGEFTGVTDELARRVGATDIKDMVAKVGLNDEDNTALQNIMDDNSRDMNTKLQASWDYLKDRRADPERVKYLQEIYGQKADDKTASTVYGFARNLTTSTLSFLSKQEGGMDKLREIATGEGTGAEKGKALRDYIVRAKWDSQDKEYEKLRTARGKAENDIGKDLVDKWYSSVVIDGKAETDFEAENLKDMEEGARNKASVRLKELYSTMQEFDEGSTMKESADKDPSQALREIFGNGDVFTKLNDVLGNLDKSVQLLLEKLGILPEQKQGGTNVDSSGSNGQRGGGGGSFGGTGASGEW